ncbi:MAG: hypothetical protein IJ776_02225 [Paludibacteraceae bacterium]|nr:hypothetical protein [Paludibacteraceae bacterium]
MNDYFSNYDANAITVINGLYNQMRNFMPQYGGYAELKKTPQYTLHAYGRNGGLVYGYDFLPNIFGNLIAIRCYGSNMAKDLQGMRTSQRIFGIPISEIDTSDYPNSVIVKL